MYNVLTDAELLESGYVEINYDKAYNEIHYLKSKNGDGNQEQTLPIRQKLLLDTNHQPDLKIHPLPSADGLLVKIQPPREPLNTELVHIPCDIILIINVFSNMAEEATVPSRFGENKESYGFSVLDLTKHAARIIMETLNEHDYLGIVTFSQSSKVRDSLNKTADRI